VANAAVVRILGHVEVEIDLRAAIRILERQAHRDLVILARNRAIGAARPAASASASRKALEEIREVEVVEGEAAFGALGAELALPIGRRAEILARLEPAAELVVRGALLGILEGLVRLRDLLEFLLGPGLLVHVRVVLLCELAIRLLDVVRARRPLDAEDCVVVLVLHDALSDSIRRAAFRATRGPRMGTICVCTLTEARWLPSPKPTPFRNSSKTSAASPRRVPTRTS
jgi:hypothetical protein